MEDEDKYCSLINAIDAFAVINDIESYLDLSEALIVGGESSEGLALVSAARRYFKC